MPLYVAPNAGFCMGVKNAVTKAREIASACRDEGLTCFSLGELIHNPFVVEKLSESGLSVAESIDEARGSVLIIRSHGVSQKVLKEAEEKAKTVHDLTCPFVKRLHDVVKAYSEGKKPIIIIGDSLHPEIIGTAGWCEGEVYIINSKEEVSGLPDDAQNALVVCQTTLQPTKWEEIIAEIRSRFPDIQAKNTICSATHKRQLEAQELAKKAGRMIVVGSRKSANTLKLYDSCLKHCKNTILVERAEEIPSHFKTPTGDIIGITAGASTPDWLLKEVVDNMNDIERIESPEMEAQLEENKQVAAVAAKEEPSEEKSFMDQVADSMKRIRNGQTVQGKVVQITEDEVCVNIGYKSDGLIKRSELVDKDVALGDTIEVEIVKVNDGEGNVILSQRNIINRKAWAEIKEKFESDEYIEGEIKEVVKGGLLANVNGVRAFIPMSQVAPRFTDKLQPFVGQTALLKILELDENKKRIVASRKAAIIEKQKQEKEAAWARLQEGEVVKGIVRRFAAFGAFVDLGGVDGLIHISDLSWNRTLTPADVLKINEEIDVKILSLDPEKERIQLGLKQLTTRPRPWDNIEEKYPIGTVLTRKVVRISDFGAFIELEPGVDGLCHISQISLHRINKVEDALQPGQEVNVKVIAVDPEKKRISLSIREALEDAAEEYDGEIPGEDLESLPEDEQE